MSERPHSFMPTPEDHERAMASLLEVLDLHDHRQDENGHDLLEASSQATPHGRVYGGQVLGQALRAAGLTVDQDLPAHSMHAYFLRAGDSTHPITFSVERLRDGRSFTARRVHALQFGRPILSLAASFQRGDAGALAHQIPMPDVPDPDDLPSFAATVADVDHPLTRFMAQSRPFDIRHVMGPVLAKPDPERRPRNAVWMRSVRPLPTDQQLLQAVLAYASDYTLLESALRQHGLAWSMPLKVASLDHAMWFHHPVPHDDWILYVQRSPFSGGGRSLGSGSLFARDGTLIASVAQEGMLRIVKTKM